MAAQATFTGCSHLFHGVLGLLIEPVCFQFDTLDAAVDSPADQQVFAGGVDRSAANRGFIPGPADFQAFMLWTDHQKRGMSDIPLICLGPDRVGNLVALVLSRQHQIEPGVKERAIAAYCCQLPGLGVIGRAAQKFAMTFLERLEADDVVFQDDGFEMHVLTP